MEWGRQGGSLDSRICLESVTSEDQSLRSISNLCTNEDATATCKDGLERHQATAKEPMHARKDGPRERILLSASTTLDLGSMSPTDAEGPAPRLEAANHTMIILPRPPAPDIRVVVAIELPCVSSLTDRSGHDRGCRPSGVACR